MTPCCPPISQACCPAGDKFIGLHHYAHDLCYLPVFFGVLRRGDQSASSDAFPSRGMAELTLLVQKMGVVVCVCLCGGLFFRTRMCVCVCVLPQGVLGGG